MPFLSRARQPRALLALLFLGSLPMAGCKVSHDPPTWHTPMETVLTYQAALAGDDENLEYRCLSEGLKKTIRRQGYSTMRGTFLKELGCIGRWVLAHNSLHDNLAGARLRGPQADLAFAIGWVTFEVTVEVDPWFRVVTRGGHQEEAVPLDEHPPTLALGPDGRPWMSVAWELPADFVQELERDGVARIQLEAVWKLKDLHVGSLLEDIAPLPTDQPHRTLTTGSLALRKGSSAMGYQVVEVLLPLDEPAVQSLRATRQPILQGTLEWTFPPMGDESGA